MKTLLLILGPTGVGKTELSLRVAEHLGSPIISCDSRQIYRAIPIGTAAPTAAELARVLHYFIGTHELEQSYNAGQYEQDAIELMERLFRTHDVLVMTGGSMLYADAVCYGLDDLRNPTPPFPQGRENLREKGLEWLQKEVQRLDPEYWARVDRCNPARLAHCVEICYATGKPYSSLLTHSVKERPFRIVKVGLERPRAELYDRINRRVEQMIADGLEQEARAVSRQPSAVCRQTVGYKELFAYFDGEYDLARAIELIKQNSRHYAKRQLTWFRRDKTIHWLNANEEYEKNIHLIDDLLRSDSVQEE